ncbi:hypothetical protein ANN_22348 [Periplaneta americana]|uniref:Uncharacterized protein n=1 Tax=Periplaneta americana TaxID=6978 RepID=A0ABQ8S7W6_PERAM|nr:hypothetical protein ANN_22348 [Periplaneta americana]
MPGLCEGGNDPSGSLEAISIRSMTTMDNGDMNNGDYGRWRLCALVIRMMTTTDDDDLKDDYGRLRGVC